MHLFETLIELLSFKLTRDEMLNFNKRHFILGLTGTWIVGMGRYWDDRITPREFKTIIKEVK